MHQATSSTVRLFLGLTAAAAMLVASGCGQRSLMAVRESGERAYEFEQYDQAMADFKEYVERLPGDPIGHYNLGRTYLKVSPARPIMAREQLQIAYAQRPNDEEVLEALCQSLLEAKQNEELYKLLRGRAVDRQQISDYMRLAKYAQRLGDVDEAKQAYLTAARLDLGQSVDLQLAIAEFYDSVRDREASLRRLRMAYYLDPNDGRVLDKVKASGAVAGPTFALKPDEMP